MGASCSACQPRLNTAHLEGLGSLPSACGKDCVRPFADEMQCDDPAACAPWRACASTAGVPAGPALCGGLRLEAPQLSSRGCLAAAGGYEEGALWADILPGELGVSVWRIEDFMPVPWPQERYGTFCVGDSYIVLETVRDSSGTLNRNVYYWIGKKSTADEMGAAAYRAAELSERLGGGMIERRELMGSESDGFKALFGPLTHVDAVSAFSEAELLTIKSFDTKLRQALPKRPLSPPPLTPPPPPPRPPCAQIGQEPTPGTAAPVVALSTWHGKNLSSIVPAVHMIICALDYKNTSFPLTCTQDGDNMMELARLCNANVEKLYNEEATVENVCKLIKMVGTRCGPDDYFVFYYAGHGANLPDQDGDEDDGQDEAFCFVDKEGRTSPKCWLRDDDFAKLVTSSVHAFTNILVLADCCHSGTVADLNKPIWDGYRAISIAGCKDQQTSGDTGKGGIFTHSLLLAIDGLKVAARSTYTVDDLYHETLIVDDEVFNSLQDITMQSRPNACMAWPLVPPGHFVAPFRRPDAAKGSQATTIDGSAKPAVKMPTIAVGPDEARAPQPELAPKPRDGARNSGIANRPHSAASTVPPSGEVLPTLLARRQGNAGSPPEHWSIGTKKGFECKPARDLAGGPFAGRAPLTASLGAAEAQAAQPRAGAKPPRAAPAVAAGGCCFGRRRARSPSTA